MRFYFKDWFETEILKKWEIKYLDICPTWRCNARCPTCNAWTRKSNDLSEKQVEQIITHPVFSNLERLVIEGGEPSVWKPLYNFVPKLLKANNKIIIAIITNGFLTKKIVELANKILPYRDQLRWLISLNGIGETHDQSRGVKNVYAKTLKTAKEVRLMGYITTFSFVPLQPNIQDYPKVLELAKDLNIDINVCYHSNHSKFGAHKWKAADKEEYDKVLDNRRVNYNLFDRWRYEYFLYHVNRNKLMPCWAGKTMAHLNPDGVLRPCHMDETKEIGKVTDNDVIIYDRKQTLDLIPKSCMYRNDQLCNDCYITYTARHSMPKVLSWKLQHIGVTK